MSLHCNLDSGQITCLNTELIQDGNFVALIQIYIPPPVTFRHAEACALLKAQKVLINRSVFDVEDSNIQVRYSSWQQITFLKFCTSFFNKNLKDIINPFYWATDIPVLDFW